jgi:hypothetical protein
LSPFPTKKKNVVCLLILFFLRRSHIINVLSAAACTRKRNVVEMIALNKYRIKGKKVPLCITTQFCCVYYLEKKELNKTHWWRLV